MKNYKKMISVMCSLSLVLGALVFAGIDTAYADRKGGHSYSDRHYSVDRHYNKKAVVIQRGHSYKGPGRHGRHHRDVIIVKPHRPHGHRHHGNSYYIDDDVYKWNAMTLITLKVLDNLDNNPY